MFNENYTWYLENNISGKKLKISDVTGVHGALDQIAPDERKDWVLKFGEFVETADAETQPGVETILELPNGSLGKFIEDSFHDDRRAHPRINLRLKVVIISGRRIFRTFTNNISLGGILLQSAPPRDYSAAPVQILLEDPTGTKQILTKSSFVDIGDQKRLRFLELSEKDRIELGKWLSIDAPRFILTTI